MAISVVQMCNVALSRIDANRIDSLTESSKAARICNTIYETIRDAVLSDFDWGFARTELTLALLTDSFSGYDYAYAYPTDCLELRKIFDETGANTGTSYDIDTDSHVQTGKVEYEIRSNASKDAKVILTDKADAVGIYTARVTDPNMFSASYVDAFADRMASDLAIPLKGKATLQQAWLKSYFLRIGKSKANNANESYKAPSDDSSFTRIRS